MTILSKQKNRSYFKYDVDNFPTRNRILPLRTKLCGVNLKNEGLMKSKIYGKCLALAMFLSIFSSVGLFASSDNNNIRVSQFSTSITDLGILVKIDDVVYQAKGIYLDNEGLYVQANELQALEEKWHCHKCEHDNEKYSRSCESGCPIKESLDAMDRSRR